MVGIDLTVWHHLDPHRLVQIHRKIGPDYEDKIIRPAVRSAIRLVISEDPVMDAYSAKRAQIQDEINTKVRALLEQEQKEAERKVIEATGRANAIMNLKGILGAASAH